MSVKAMSWVWDNSGSRGIDRLVLLALADSADDSGRNAWPSMTTLARKTRVDIRTVQRSIRRLSEMGEVMVAENAGAHGVNVYTVTMTPGTAPPPEQRHPGRESPNPRHSAGGTPGRESPNPRHSATQTVLKPPTEPSINHPRGARATRLPDDWYPSTELIAWVKTDCPNVDGRAQTESFRDYWHAKAGKDAIKMDWPATYRRWMRTEQERVGRGTAFPGRQSIPRIATADQRLADGMALAQRLAAQDATPSRLEIDA